jgi:protoheme IX farnesyltransferase
LSWPAEPPPSTSTRNWRRTRDRPIPTGRIQPRSALKTAAALIAGGLVVLSRGGPTPALLGLGAVLWYNGVYFRLKKHSAFAAVPGALTGAVPPAIGWVCGGGRLTDPGCVAAGLFFFMWQVPHFWVVVLDRGLEYRGAGFPSLIDVFTGSQIRRVISVWVLGTAACSLFLLFPGSAIRHPLTRYALLAASLWLASLGLSFFFDRLRQGADLFRRLNFYMLGLFVLLGLDRLWGILGF